MKTVNFKAGDTILSEGDEGRSAFLIVSGTVEVTVGKGSDATIVGTFMEGDVFGEMSLIEPGARTATVKAITDTECVETSYEDFVARIHENPEAAMQFMKTLVRRLRHMNELMTTMDPKKRTLRQVLHDWQTSSSERPGWADRDEQRRYEEMMDWRMI
jgi:CRP/FNR family cyclic AMP-dependent transcriptional regulator